MGDHLARELTSIMRRIIGLPIAAVALIAIDTNYFPPRQSLAAEGGTAAKAAVPPAGYSGRDAS